MSQESRRRPPTLLGRSGLHWDNSTGNGKEWIDHGLRGPHLVNPETAWAAGVFLALVLCVFSALRVAGFNPSNADVQADWLATRASVISDAYQPLTSLAVEFGVPFQSVDPPVEGSPAELTSYTIPRTPGALLFLLPIALLPFDTVYAAWIAASVGMLWWIVVIVGRAAGLQWRTCALGFLVAAVSVPGTETLKWASQALLVALLMVPVWVDTFRGRDRTLAGLGLGAAGVLKVFPFALLIPLALNRRWRTFWACVVSALALNLAGLILPGVSLARAFHVFLESSDLWLAEPNNTAMAAAISQSTQAIHVPGIAGMLISALIAAICLYLFRDHPGQDDVYLVMTIIGLLAIPISWPAYDVALIAGLLGGLARGSRVMTLAVAGAWLVAPSMSLLGLSANRALWVFIGRLFFVVAAVIRHQVGRDTVNENPPLSSTAEAARRV